MQKPLIFLTCPWIWWCSLFCAIIFSHEQNLTQYILRIVDIVIVIPCPSKEEIDAFLHTPTKNILVLDLCTCFEAPAETTVFNNSK